MFTVGQTVETTAVTHAGFVPRGTRGTVMSTVPGASYITFADRRYSRMLFWINNDNLKPIPAPHVRVPVAEIAAEFPQLAGALGVRA